MCVCVGGGGGGACGDVKEECVCVTLSSTLEHTSEINHILSVSLFL